MRFITQRYHLASTPAFEAPKGAAWPSSPQHTSVGHWRPAGLAPARRVTDSADMSHSSHYDTRVTRGVSSDVSLNCDDGLRRLAKASAPACTISGPRYFASFLII